MPILTRFEIDQALRDASTTPRPPVTVATLTAIAFAESGGRLEAVGDNAASGHQPDPNGPYRWDIGLFQTNSIHGFEPTLLLSDARYAAESAWYVYDMQGFGAWSTYNGGQWAQFYEPPTEPSPPPPPDDYIGLHIDRFTESSYVTYEPDNHREVHVITTTEHIYDRGF